MEAEVYHPKLALAKLQPAPLQSRCIYRDRLLSALINKESSVKVILVQAPAGYGKSILLTQYWQYCLQEQLQTLWLTLDKGDNDIERLVRHLYASWDTSASLQSDSHNINYQGFLERLASCTQPLRIFFDNFETIHSPIVLQYIQQIIEYRPLDSEVIIGSRHLSNLELGRMRSYGHLLEINQKDLLFSFTETTHLLEKISGLVFREQTIQVLLDRTEGWITAIQLAVLALSKHQDAELFFSTFSGSHTEIAQYLAEDILSKLSAAHRDFLLKTSILSELNASLCNYVTQDEDSEAQLELLAQKNLFLSPTDNSHSQYRYHNLFSSYLLNRLKAIEPKLYLVLNHRAASWYLEQNRPVMAIEHLLEDPNQQPAISLLNKYAMGLLIEGRFRRLLRWFDKLSPSSFQQHPSLQLIYGWVLVLNRRHSEAQKVIDNFLNKSAQSTTDDRYVEIQALQCLQLSMTDQIAVCYEQTKTLLSTISINQQPSQSLIYGVLISIMAYCLIVEGKYDSARQIMNNALHQNLKLQNTFIRSLCDALEGWIDLIQGQMQQAALRLQRSYKQVWIKGEKSIPGGKAVIGVPYAELLYEKNELSQAQYILGECLPYVRENGTVDSLILAYLLLSKISRYKVNNRVDKLVNNRVDNHADNNINNIDNHVHEETKRAHLYLQELEDIGNETGLKRVIMSVKLEQSRIHWLSDHLGAAKLALAQVEEMHIPNNVTHVAWPAHDIESQDVMHWRLLISGGQVKQAEIELKRALKTAQAAGRLRRALKIQILLSNALFTLNKINPAMRILTDALIFASQQGFVRIFLDEGHSIDALITLWLQKNSDKIDELSICRDFLSQLSDFEFTPDTKNVTQPIKALTKRELQTLELLAKGMRNREIAETLFISETTTKTHLRSIYAKLEANSRTETVAIARKLGLL